MTQTVHRRREHRDDAFWGITLIALGTWLLLVRAGALHHVSLHNWWPLLLVGVAVLRLATARSPKSIGSAVTLAGIGAWCWIAVNDWHGLTWHRSWPLALVAVGTGIVVRALAESVWPRREEDDHASR